MTFRFADPAVLFLLFLVPVLIVFVKKIGIKRQSFIRFSNQDLIKGLKSTFKMSLARKMIYLRAFSLCLFILALARPQSVLEKTKIHVEGIDIVLAVDASSSMRAMDFQRRNRREFHFMLGNLNSIILT